MTHPNITTDTIDQLITVVGDKHATVIVRHHSRNIDTDESIINFLMAVPEMKGVARTTGKYTREEFAAAADSVARDLSGDPEVGGFANAWLYGNVAASDGFPDRFIDEVATRVFASN